MIIGNAVGISAIPTSLFSPSQTLSSIIANEFNEASGDLQLSALIGLGLVLFTINPFYQYRCNFHSFKGNKV